MSGKNVRGQSRTLYGNVRLCPAVRQFPAQSADVEPITRQYEGQDPVGFVVSLNLKRRHLNESQRAMVAAEIANMKHGQNQHVKQDAQICRSSVSVGDAATLLNVSRSSIQRAREVRELGTPELVAAVESGAASVSAAACCAGSVTSKRTRAR